MSPDVFKRGIDPSPAPPPAPTQHQRHSLHVSHANSQSSVDDVITELLHTHLQVTGGGGVGLVEGEALNRDKNKSPNAG